ncbi:MAG: DUF1003 domain-containing protein [Verrucomicrobiota bacterium]
MKITEQTKKYIEMLSKTLLGEKYSQLSSEEKTVIESIATGQTIAENANEEFEEQLTFGQRVADRIAAFGGSWPFIILFFILLVSWMTINTVYITSDEAFDPYPFILLNLVLSSLAAFQAPVIMMSQNRQTVKDRIEVEKNYQMSLKTDLEIIRLHQKMDLILKSLNLSEFDE